MKLTKEKQKRRGEGKKISNNEYNHNKKEGQEESVKNCKLKFV